MIRRKQPDGSNEGFILPPPTRFKFAIKIVASQALLTENIELVQITDNGVIIDVKKGFFSQGERVVLYINSDEFLSKVKKIHMEAKQDRESVELDFLKFDPVVWEKICSAFRERQGVVLRAFDSIRD